MHGPNSNLSKQVSLTENGDTVLGRGDTPNQHDILTGSTLDGRTLDDGVNHTCNNWTSNGSGSAQVATLIEQVVVRILLLGIALTAPAVVAKKI